MKRFLIIALIIFALIMGLIALIFVGLKFTDRDETVSLSDGLVLEVNLESGFVEYRSSDPFDVWLNGEQRELNEIVQAIRLAAEDDRVEGLIATVGNVPAGLAQLQELRDAVTEFTASGKRSVAFAETFGEWTLGNGSYYLATAFDEIYMQPSGDVGLVGLMYEIPFVKEGLAKLEIDPLFGQRYEYKNAVNTFIENDMTPPHREAMKVLMESQFDQMVRGIAASLEHDPEQVREWFDAGPYLGEEAVELGIIDELRYRDEVYEDVLGEGRRLLYLSRYYSSAGRKKSRGATKVAFIRGVGGVVRGSSGVDPLTGERAMGSTSVAAAFREARSDGSVDAILFRVDSPGGSYVASDTIYREVLKAQEEGIPVIVSMGNLAASGGYFVSMAADRIVAQPGTITGSIGVYGGKFYTREMWKRLGIHWDHVATGPHASLWNASMRRSPSEQERFEASLDRIYQDFTQKVSETRGLEWDAVHEVARGRVWTGEDALERGLVDALGGIHEAKQQIREVLDLEQDAALKLVAYPSPKTPWQTFFAPPKDNSDDFAQTKVRQLQEHVNRMSAVMEALGVSSEQATPIADPRLKNAEEWVK